MIPVIFLHYGYSYYIENNMKICAKNNHVIFLGDQDNKELVRYIENLEFYYMDDFRDKNNTFYLGKLFKEFFRTHESREFLKTDNYRIFCLEKWLILRNFLNEKKYDSAFVFDTDNIILQDLSYYLKEYEKYDFIRFHEIGFQSYVKTSVVNEFCAYLMNSKYYFTENIMSKTNMFISSKNFNYIIGDIEDINNNIYDNAISVNTLNKYETISDISILQKISHNMRPIKMVYYDLNKNLYFKRIEDGEYLKLLNLNLSWVLRSYYNEVSSFIINEDKKIEQENFIKR
jgi:hypothetical protein